jgi:hypothetical protein
MFTTSEGFTTGIARYTPNKYQLLNNTVIDATIAEYSGKSTTMNTEDASLECTKKECDVFVREERDGATKFYQMTELPYAVDKYHDQIVSKQKVDAVLVDTSSKKKEPLVTQPEGLEPIILHQNDKNKNKNTKTTNIIIIIAFIAFIVIIIYLSSSKKGSPLYEHRPYMGDESGVLV